MSVTIRAVCFADYDLFRGLHGSDSTTPPPHLPAKRGETLSERVREEGRPQVKPMSRSTPPAACLRDLCFTGYNGKIQFILRWLQHPIASFFSGVHIWLVKVLGRFSINYFRGLGLRIRVRVWVRVNVRVRVSVVIWSG